MALISIPAALPVYINNIEDTSLLANCDLYCQDWCQDNCENCLGTGACEGGTEGCSSVSDCQNVCLSVCQNCLGDNCQSSCQLSEGCQSICQINCQNCQGVPCQTCQNCQTTCLLGCQSTCQLSSQIPPAGGTLTVIGYTATTASFVFDAVPRAEYYEIVYRRSTVTGIEGRLNTGSNTYGTVTGLIPATTYLFRYQAYNSYGEGGYSDPAVTLTTLSKPSEWSWNNSNGDASDAQTQLAFQSLAGGKTTDFNHLVWNDLVNKVNEVLITAGMNWDSTTYGLDVESTKMFDNYTLTAQKWNSLLYNIKQFTSLTLTYVSTSMPVLGSYFIQITTSINNYIRSL